MKKNVIAVFDIGKTNKKILLFDESYKVVLVEEQKFNEIKATISTSLKNG